jgi:hypothetical protein
MYNTVGDPTILLSGDGNIGPIPVEPELVLPADSSNPLEEKEDL